MSGHQRRLPSGTGYILDGLLAGARRPIWCENWSGDKVLVGPLEMRRWVLKTQVTWARKADGRLWDFFYRRWGRRDR